jgi:hypothetical protein
MVGKDMARKYNGELVNKSPAGAGPVPRGPCAELKSYLTTVSVGGSRCGLVRQYKYPVIIRVLRKAARNKPMQVMVIVFICLSFRFDAGPAHKHAGRKIPAVCVTVSAPIWFSHTPGEIITLCNVVGALITITRNSGTSTINVAFFE